MFAVWISVKSPIIETTLFLSWLCPVLSSQYHLTFWWKLLQCSVLTLQSHANLNKNFIFSSDHITAHSLNHKCLAIIIYVCNGISVMSMIFNKALIIKKQLKSHYHYTVNTSFKPGRRDWAGNTEQRIRRGLLEQNWPSLKEPRHSVVCWDRDYLIFRTWLSLICPHWEMDNGITSASATGASH